MTEHAQGRTRPSYTSEPSCWKKPANVNDGLHAYAMQPPETRVSQRHAVMAHLSTPAFPFPLETQTPAMLELCLPPTILYW